MSLVPHIYQYLLVKKKVSLIGVGTFRISQRPARIHLATSKALPPDQKIVFIDNLSVEDDGLIAYISQMEKHSVDEVRENIIKTVEEWKQALATDKKLDLIPLGVLKKQINDKLIFEQSPNLILDPTTFGLNSFRFLDKTPLERQENSRDSTKGSSIKDNKINSGDSNDTSLNKDKFEEYLENDVHPKEIEEAYYQEIKLHNQKIMNQKIIIAISSLVLVLVLIYFIFQPFSKHPIDSSLLPNQGVVSGEEVFELSTEDTLPDIVVEKVIDRGSISRDNSPIEDANKSMENPVVNSNQAYTQPQYHVIGGSFEFESNAKKFFKQLQSLGYERAYYVGETQSGFHRVSYGSFSNLEEARVFLKKIKMTVDEKAWLLTIKEE